METKTHRKFIEHLSNIYRKSDEHLSKIDRNLWTRTSIEYQSMMRAALLSNVLHVDHIEDEDTHGRPHK